MTTIHRTLAVLICLAATANLAAAEPKTKKLLILGIDGVRTDALKIAITPHFDKLVKQGAWAENTDALSKRYDKNFTLSGPGWSSILTGVWADKHKVNNNQFRNADYKRYPHLFTRLKQARPRLRTASIASWEPLHEQIPSLAELQRTVKTTDDLDRRADRDVARVACDLLETKDYDATFVYFAQIDNHGHEYGFHPAVKEYLAAIEQVDDHIGELIKAIHSRKTYDQEDWLIIAATDHGGQGNGHQYGREVPEIRIVWLLVSGPSAKQGKVEAKTHLVDVVPTALTHLGVKIKDEWKLDGKPVGLSSD